MRRFNITEEKIPYDFWTSSYNGYDYVNPENHSKMIIGFKYFASWSTIDKKCQAKNIYDQNKKRRIYIRRDSDTLKFDARIPQNTLSQDNYSSAIARICFISWLIYTYDSIMFKVVTPAFDEENILSTLDFLDDLPLAWTKFYDIDSDSFTPTGNNAICCAMITYLKGKGY